MSNFRINDRVVLVSGQYAGQQGKINISPVSGKCHEYGVLLDSGRGLAAIPAAALQPVGDGARPKNHLTNTERLC